jgi:hydrogenase maturation factor
VEGKLLMCTSRYFHVTDTADDVAVLAEDVEGRQHRLALIAYDGPPPQRGTWVVAHSGYALAPADADEAALAFEELRRGTAQDNGLQTDVDISEEE